MRLALRIPGIDINLLHSCHHCHFGNYIKDSCIVVIKMVLVLMSGNIGLCRTKLTKALPRGVDTFVRWAVGRSIGINTFATVKTLLADKVAVENINQSRTAIWRDINLRRVKDADKRCYSGNYDL